jgi:nicotinate-nucleotide adenylyltransferase
MANQAEKRIGLFGGTFDPIHMGHLIVAEWITDSLELDKTIFIPNNIHPFRKRSDITGSQHRLKMVEKAIQEFPRFDVSDLELRNEGVSYTIDTLHYFISEYPESNIYYIMGADNLKDFTSWKQPHEILKLVNLVVYNRPGIEINESLEHERMILIDSPFIDISSTHVRHRIREHRAFRSLVPPEVYRYITEHKLYLDES